MKLKISDNQKKFLAVFAVGFGIAYWYFFTKKPAVITSYVNALGNPEPIQSNATYSSATNAGTVGGRIRPSNGGGSTITPRIGGGRTGSSSGIGNGRIIIGGGGAGVGGGSTITPRTDCDKLRSELISVFEYLRLHPGDATYIAKATYLKELLTSSNCGNYMNADGNSCKCGECVSNVNCEGCAKNCSCSNKFLNADGGDVDNLSINRVLMAQKGGFVNGDGLFGITKTTEATTANTSYTKEQLKGKIVYSLRSFLVLNDKYIADAQANPMKYTKAQVDNYIKNKKELTYALKNLPYVQ